MHRSQPGRSLKRRVKYRLQLESLEDRLAPATFTVVSTSDLGDDNPGDGVATTDSGPSGFGLTTLRAAIEEANALAGPDVIEFNLFSSGGGPATFFPATEYPAIVEALTINGYTQPGASANSAAAGTANDAQLRIVINGSGIPTGANGLTVTTSAPNQPVLIRGLVIQGFLAGSGNDGFAIALENDSGGHAIEGNFLGTDFSGTAAVPNAGGGVLARTANNRIGGTALDDPNLISGNNGPSILIETPLLQGSAGNTVQGNLIGVTPSGLTALANNGDGVRIQASSGNQIGGTAPAARNLISGNQQNGVFIKLGRADDSIDFVTADLNRVEGNFIGTDITGTLAIGNQLNGVLVSGGNSNVIGGTSAGARNLVSNNASNGIELSAFVDTTDVESEFVDKSELNLVQGNFIGTDITGTFARPNGGSGVAISGSDNNLIGGTSTAARNLISGNREHGVLITEFSSPQLPSAESERNRVQGNFIGTQIDGVSDLGNGGAGVRIQESEYNTIGGTEAGAGNVIAFNRQLTEREGTGVEIALGATGNPILGNSIFSNLGLGIDLFEGDNVPGFTENDNDDANQNGGNNLQNFPVLTSAVASPTATTITGTVNSRPDRTFRIEFFANLAADNDSPAGEGRTFLGFVNTTTNGDGDASFTAILGTLPAGQNVITATATNITLTVTSGGVLEPQNDTSEFSRAFTAILAPVVAPTLVAVPARVFHPFRLVRQRSIFSGFITLLPKVNALAPTTIVLHNLPRSVRLLNATGTTPQGDPFITVNRGLRKNVPLRIRVVYTNTQGRYSITFYHGFRVDVFSGSFQAPA